MSIKQFNSFKNVIILSVLFLMLSCVNSTDKPTIVTKIETETIIKDNAVLHIRFDNQKNTATLTINNETTELEQDTTASGISYSNKNYTYTNWHGLTIVTKNGVEIYKHQDELKK